MRKRSATSPTERSGSIAVSGFEFPSGSVMAGHRNRHPGRIQVYDDHMVIIPGGLLDAHTDWQTPPLRLATCPVVEPVSQGLIGSDSLDHNRLPVLGKEIVREAERTGNLCGQFFAGAFVGIPTQHA